MDADGPSRRISVLTLRSIRKFEKFDVQFDRLTPDGGGVTVVTGENGACRSTLLRAIAIRTEIALRRGDIS